MYPTTPVSVTSRDQRAHLGRIVDRDPELDPLHRRHEELDELVVDALVEQDPGVRPAGLARRDVEVHPHDRCVHRVGDPSVRKDDQRVLAAELERDLLDAVGGGAQDRPSRLDAARESDASDLGMLDERAARRRPVTA